MGRCYQAMAYVRAEKEGKNLNQLAGCQLFGYKSHCELFIDMDMDEFATRAIWFSSD